MKLTLNLGNMRSYAVAVVAGVLLLAGYSQKGEAAACSSLGGTYQDLIDAGTCSIDGLDIGTFVYSDVDTALNAEDISYQVIFDVPGNRYGFLFTANFKASGTAATGPISQDFLISYTIECSDDSACINSVHADITGSSSGPDAVISIGETYNGGLTGNAPGTLSLTGNRFWDDVFPDNTNPTTPPVSSLTITKDFLALCINAPDSNEPDPACFASMSGARNTVDLVIGPESSGPTPSTGTPGVPEPASLSLLAAGLMALGLYRRRRNRA